jgi:outer membrane protein OmpA-like peptidoglycan-associated protein
MDLVSELRPFRPDQRLPRLSLVAAIAIVLLFGAAVPLALALERRLEIRARAALTSAGAGWAMVEMSGRTGLIRGTPPNETARLVAMQSVLASSGSGWLRGVSKVRYAPGEMSRDKAGASAAPACSALSKGLEPTTFQFDLGAAGLTGSQLDRISVMAAELLSCSNWDLIIEGHADATGSRDANMRLSARRAEAVRSALMEAGVPGERMTVSAYGASRPVRGSGGAIEPEASRRIEIRLIRRDRKS